MLHRFPIDFQAMILQTWLTDDLPVLSTLDVAYCNTKHRKTFLKVIQSDLIRLDAPCKISFDFLLWLASRQPGVISLLFDVSMMKQILEQRLSAPFGRIEKLLLSKDKYMKSLEPTDFCHFAQLFPTLRTLDCSPCAFNIKDDLLIVIINGMSGACPALEEVNITDCINLTDQSVWNLVNRIPGLKHLRSSAVISSATWQSVAEHCPGLQEVEMNISSLTAVELLGFVKKASSLHALTLREETFEEYEGEANATGVITDELVWQIFQAKGGVLKRFAAARALSLHTFCKVLSTNPQLEYLSFGPTTYDAIAKALTVEGNDEDALLSVFNIVPAALSVLVLSDTFALPAWLLNVIADRFGSTLEEVAVCLGADIKEAHITHFLASCPLLWTLLLHLRHVILTNDNVFQHLHTVCPLIGSLALFDCDVLTNDTLLEIVKGYGNNLHALGITGCRQLTDALLPALASYSRLQRLDADGTAMSLEALDAFMRDVLKVKERSMTLSSERRSLKEREESVAPAAISALYGNTGVELF